MRTTVFLLFAFLLWSCVTNSENANKESEELNTNAYSREKVVERYPNGLLKLQGELLGGKRHGVWVFYYENGKKWSEGKYRNGVRYGYSTVYYENGKKKLAGEYENDLRVGVWQVWNDDGSLAAEINMNEKLNAADSLKLNLK